ncbi:uncharacterized protein B0P05DRAFT_143803 [Gilbertella persicaria]|uniref:uncharacterized protein n=1 Tax=Gilbertella persicaria TaxID=101096 RepID=UPI00221ECC26|nr:uncharacterized protein B0P05DRAFT_143803 [Gilbertella persicaria]KAI8075781.1 hypothetical protein B0P05DRAFT_143803 [Gilbertella persicaria]
MPSSKVSSMMKTLKTTPLEHLTYPPVLNTWKLKTRAANEKLLMTNLLPCTTKPTINECFEQLPSTLPMDEVEEDIQIPQVGTAIEEEDVVILAEEDQKTTLEEGDVGTQPSTTTTTSPTILTVQHQQTTQPRDLPVNNNAKVCTSTTNQGIISTTTITTTSIILQDLAIQIQDLCNKYQQLQVTEWCDKENAQFFEREN